MSKIRKWFLTINNPTENEMKAAMEHSCKYIIVGEEVGEQKGTLHLHLFIEYQHGKSFKKMKKLWPRANIKKASGEAGDSKNYLLKGKILREEGEPSQNQGCRNDIHAVKEMVKEGRNIREIVENATSFQAIKVAEKLMIYYEPKRTWRPDVKWYCGPTGTGKTRTAYEELIEKYGDAYITMDTANWWQGYDAHKGVIIDDFRKDFCKFHTLLRILDRYPYQVETKGGSRQFVPETIIVTCPFEPAVVYDTREDVEQLLRRINCIKNFSDKIYTNYATEKEEHNKATTHAKTYETPFEHVDDQSLFDDESD